METIDLSNEMIDISGDRSFDKKDVRGALEYLKAVRDASVDYILDGNSIVIEEMNDEKWELWAETPEGIKVFQPTNYAQRQTITKTPLPAKYHDELVEHGHITEAVKHLNLWLHEDKMHRIRTVGNKYRAIVSPSYGSYDNHDIFAAVARTIKTANMMRNEETQPAQFHVADISEENMYLNIVDWGRKFDIGKADEHYPLIRIRNSEVGAGAFQVDAGFFRGMCENRMLTGVISRKIHRAEKLESGIYSIDTLQTQAELVMKIVRDQIGAAFASDVFFDEIATSLRESKEIKLDSTTEAIEKVSGLFKLTKEEEEELLNAMSGDTTISTEDRGTVFALINGLTLVAKNKPIEQQMRYIENAGRIKEIMRTIT